MLSFPPLQKGKASIDYTAGSQKLENLDVLHNIITSKPAKFSKGQNMHFFEDLMTTSEESQRS